jgi:S-adenosylmethionine:tRNA ribosyltransferase-isomerase
VFAEHPGSVAAPTAGLHFTEPLLEQLRSRGICIEKVTLHVGVGTFRPLTSDSIEDHQMHREWCRLDPSTANRLRGVRDSGGRIIAAGTTTVRTLESAASSGVIEPWEGETDLFIRPPFCFQAIDGLITNFHLPRSTLLVLVRVFGGDALIRRAYQEAIDEQYRFFSYGDAMLVL